MNTHALEGGFSDPAVQSARAFRAVMEAMARPGALHIVEGAEPPPPLSSAAGAVLLTLCDLDTGIHLAGTADCPALRDWIAFHTGAPIVSAPDASFAVGSWSSLAPLNQFRIGTPEYPDRSATLIVETAQLSTQGAVLAGPGIKTRAALSLPETKAFQSNHALFPLGLDFLFTSGDRLAALPRSTEVL